MPMGDMKGVLDSEAEPNVAARDMSDPLPLGCCCLPPPPLPEIVTVSCLRHNESLGRSPPGNRCRGSALPLLCRDLSMWTGVDLGEMKGEAGGDWPPGPWARGEMGWKLKWRLLVPGEGGTGQGCAPPPELGPVSASLTIKGWKETRLLVDS